MTKIFSILITAILFMASCKSKDASNTTTATTNNYLSFKINGVEWKADTKSVFAAFHPEGYTNAILISGTIGEGAAQQAFNINMYRTTGISVYIFSNITEAVYPVDRSVAQLGNLNPQDYLYGGLMGLYNFKVKITSASKNPAMVEGTFEGTLTGVRADVLTITEGKFSYHE